MKKICLLLVFCLCLSACTAFAEKTAETSALIEQARTAMEPDETDQAHMKEVLGADSETAAGTAGHRITEKTVTTYIRSESAKTEFPYCFLDGQDGIPWIELDTWLPIYEKLFAGDDAELTLTRHAEGEHYALLRENDAAMIFDFEKNTITFNNYNLFMSFSYARSMMDILATRSFDKDGKPFLFQRLDEMSFDRSRGEKVFDLAPYGIDLVYQDGKYYVPLSTFADICLTPKTNLCFVYNDEAVFYITDGSLGRASLTGELTPSPLGEIYYSAEPRDRTEEEARYGYAELCLMLDQFYGLKKIHQISDFDTLFTEIGVKDALMSADAGLADIALKAVISLYIDDLHSRFLLPTWMTPAENGHKVLRTARAMKKITEDIDTYKKAREESNPGGVPAYQEIGNTAYITFDQFSATALAMDPYSLTEEQMEQLAMESADTVPLVIYAHRQITRENSPVENVVLDLSNNTGGATDAAAFVISWYLGAADLAFQDQNTGIMSALAYRADVNLDREYDDRDVLTGKNLYCLISPVSFSCGNLVPASFKSSQKVTLIGRKSGGGSCAVRYASTAWGTFFKMSGPVNLSVLKNGSLYDIDTGIDPDYYLSKLSSFYDRQKLTEIINRMD